jgi:glycosyltransferase involved in cell wall biosynthesis
LASNPAISNSIHFVGEVCGTEKNAVLSLADLFVLPSESEGFSNSVLEAMSWSTPVLISPGCNFDQVESESVGWIANPTPTALSRKLVEVTSDPRELAYRGMRARELILKSFSIDRVVDMYEALLTRKLFESDVHASSGDPPASESEDILFKKSHNK